MTRALPRQAKLILLALLALVSRPAAASAALAASPPAPADPRLQDRGAMQFSPVERVAPGKFKMGDIEVNKSERTVSFPAAVNMDQGMLEYLLVRVGGKTHESLLRTEVEPLNLQVACLLLGIEGSATPAPFQGSPQIPGGDPVAVSIVLQDGSRVTPEQWMAQIEGSNKKEVPQLKWRFTGSIVKGGRFGAQATGSMIAVYHDPIAMIDHASPGGEIDGGWLVKEGAVPAVGTPVTVVIKSLK